jgi:transposase-like protein
MIAREAKDSKLSCASEGIHTWHLDEVFVKVNGKLCYLWRASDHSLWYASRPDWARE